MRSTAEYTLLVMALAACSDQRPKESAASATRRDLRHRVDAAPRDTVQAARLARVRPLEISAPTLVLFYPVPDRPYNPDNSVHSAMAREAEARAPRLAALAEAAGFDFAEHYSPVGPIYSAGRLLVLHPRPTQGDAGYLFIAPTGRADVHLGLASDATVEQWLAQYRAALDAFGPGRARTSYRQPPNHCMQPTKRLGWPR